MLAEWTAPDPDRRQPARDWFRHLSAGQSAPPAGAGANTADATGAVVLCRGHRAWRGADAGTDLSRTVPGSQPRQKPRGRRQPDQRQSWNGRAGLRRPRRRDDRSRRLPAWLVYRYPRPQFVSRSWFNLETVWAVSLILVGGIALVLESPASHRLRQRPVAQFRQRSLLNSPSSVPRAPGRRAGAKRFLRNQPRVRRGLFRELLAGPGQADQQAAAVVGIGAGLRSGRARKAGRSRPLMVATSIECQPPELVLRARPGFVELGERRPLRRRQVDADLAGEDRGVALPDLAQDEADLLVQDIGRSVPA